MECETACESRMRMAMRMTSACTRYSAEKRTSGSCASVFEDTARAFAPELTTPELTWDGPCRIAQYPRSRHCQCGERRCQSSVLDLARIGEFPASRVLGALGRARAGASRGLERTTRCTRPDRDIDQLLRNLLSGRVMMATSGCEVDSADQADRRARDSAARHPLRTSPSIAARDPERAGVQHPAARNHTRASPRQTREAGATQAAPRALG